MTSSVFNLEDNKLPGQPADSDFRSLENAGKIQKPGKLRGIAKAIAAVLGLLIVISAIGGYFYWQRMKATPQYSLALLIDAARQDDQNEVDRLVDTGRVVDSFIPQITAKAIEMYGRGVPNVTIKRIAEISAPLIPAVKDRARAELPNVIRERTEQFQSIPFTAMVLGADRYLQIDVDGDLAFVKSKLRDRPFEIKMQKNAGRWQVIGVTDEQLATKIAQRVGQDIIAIASQGAAASGGPGIQNLNNIVRQAEELFKQN